MEPILKSDKLLNSTTSLATSLSLIISGLIMVIGRDWLYTSVVNIFISLLLLVGVFQFIKYIFQKLSQKERKETFTKSFSYLLFCLILSSFRTIPLSIMPLIFSIYMLLNAGIKFLTYFVLLQSKENGRLSELFFAIIYLAIGIPLLFAPIKNVSTMLILIGSYFILLGFTYLKDFITTLIPTRVKTKIRRKFRVTLPVLLEAIIPYSVLKEINYQWNKDAFNKNLVYEEKKIEEKSDLEVFIHVAPSGYNRFGHVDICVGSKIISYGGYDFATSKLFNMIGEGTLFEADRDKYIDVCTRHSNKTLFCFGLKLTERQKENIGKQIDSIMNNTIPFLTPYEKDKQEHIKRKKSEYQDYPSRLVILANAKFYKITKGPFKTFFVLGVNCCKLADNIIGKSGVDILKMTGLITPGAYYEYLNQEFYRKNSMVISKTTYNNHMVKNKRKIFSSGSMSQS